MKTTTRQIFFFYIVSLAIVLLSCTSTKPKISDTLDSEFTELVNNEELNKYFEVRPVSGQEIYKLGSDVRVFLYNSLDEKILFPVGYGIKLFIVFEDKWIEIDNRNNYSGETVMLPTVSNQNIGARLVFGVPNCITGNVTLGSNVASGKMLLSDRRNSLSEEPHDEPEKQA
jgi:hypothetical protein